MQDRPVEVEDEAGRPEGGGLAGGGGALEVRLDLPVAEVRELGGAAPGLGAELCGGGRVEDEAAVPG
ncbi:Hypothetical protein GLP15_3500, partial [Giardia lamblia P15]